MKNVCCICNVVICFVSFRDQSCLVKSSHSTLLTDPTLTEMRKFTVFAVALGLGRGLSVQTQNSAERLMMMMLQLQQQDLVVPGAVK